MNAEDEKRLRLILAEVGVVETEYTNADWWVAEENEYGVPVLQKALFLREAWRAVIRADDPAWFPALLTELDRSKGDGDVYYTSRMVGRSPELLKQMEQLACTEQARDALTVLVRASQIKVLSELIQLLDGGYTFEPGLGAKWALCTTDSGGDPSRAFGDMAEVLWSFDPNRKI